jgi:hypothetical protein
MPRGFKRLLAALLCCVSCTPAPQAPFKPERWAVYYNNKLPSKAFMKYDLVVFDREYHPNLKPLLNNDHTTVLAYISAGEIHGHMAKEIKQLKEEDAIFKENKQWDSSVVSLTSASWRNMVLEQVADARNQGFHGVMLDTLDSTLAEADKRSPELGKANRAAAIQLLADIRQTYPELKIMMNRGLAILPDVSAQLDFILAESILSETNVSTGQYNLFSPSTYRQVAEMLQDAARNSPQLKIYTLDYWNQDDVDGIKLLYALQRENGFSPYVTTPDLHSLSPEPHSRKDIRNATAENVAIGRGDS